MVSICHCLSCQRRTGSAFGMQAGFRADQVQVAGRYIDYARTSDEQDRKVHVFHFCPDCGGTVFYTEPDEDDLVVVMVGAFADPEFPPPTESGYGERRHRWFDLPAGIASDEVWAPLQPLYEAGEYAEVADRGRALVAEHPEHPRCCTTSPAAKAWPGGRAMPSSICGPRSSSTRSFGRWRPMTPTSIRSGTNRRSAIWWASPRRAYE